MKVLLILISATFFFSGSRAQSFHIVDEIPCGENISAKENINNVSFRICNDTIYQIRQINKINNKYDLKITLIGIHHEGVLRSDTVRNIPSSFKIKDFSVRQHSILITANEQLLLCELDKTGYTIYMHPDSLIPKNDTLPYKFCNFLNDTIALLYTIYDYHPVDDRGGVYLRTFNINTRQFEKIKFMKFPGIAIAHMSSNWVAVVAGYIYIITPLSGYLYQLDQNLNLIDQYDMRVFQGKDLEHNLAFQAYTDSIIDFEANRILTIVSKYPKDSITYHSAEYASNIYTKDFFYKNITTVTSKNTFINQIYSKDDSLIVLSVSRPGYNNKYVDLLYCDPMRKKVIKSYEHFPCAAQDTLLSPEDFFSINFAIDKTSAPQFYNGYVYSGSLFGTSSFKPGKYDDVSLQLFNASKNSGFHWNVHKYKLD